VTDHGAGVGSGPPQPRRFRAVVLVWFVALLCAVGLFLITRSSVQTIVIILVFAVVSFLLLRALSAVRRFAAERAMADNPAVLGTIVGSMLLEDVERSAKEQRRHLAPREQVRPAAPRQRPMIVCLFADRIVIRPVRERGPAESQTIRNRDVFVAEWSVQLSRFRPAPLLRLAAVDGFDISLLFDDAGQYQQLAQFRDILDRVLPKASTGDPLPASVNGSNRVFIAAIVVGAVLGAAVIPLSTMVARGSDDVGVDGYHTFSGQDHRLLVPGRPWGHPCIPIVLQLDPDVPETIRLQAETVVAQARAGGANLVLSNENQAFDPTQLRLPDKGDVAYVAIFAHDKGPTKSDGQPLRFEATWHTVRDLDGSHDVLTQLKGDLYTEPLDGDPVITRKALRVIVARTAGVAAGATTPGTGLAAGLEQSADQFTASDLKAMRVFSGCSDK
jgi:hypothetical protein